MNEATIGDTVWFLEQITDSGGTWDGVRLKRGEVVSRDGNKFSLLVGDGWFGSTRIAFAKVVNKEWGKLRDAVDAIGKGN